MVSNKLMITPSSTSYLSSTIYDTDNESEAVGYDFNEIHGSVAEMLAHLLDLQNKLTVYKLKTDMLEASNEQLERDLLTARTNRENLWNAAIKNRQENRKQQDYMRSLQTWNKELRKQIVTLKEEKEHLKGTVEFLAT
jgi:chromosome segregation ATPase